MHLWKQRAQFKQKKKKETLLIPYALSGLSDECNEIASSAFESLERIGENYENDYEDRTKEKRFYEEEREQILRKDFLGLKPILFFPFKGKKEKKSTTNSINTLLF